MFSRLIRLLWLLAICLLGARAHGQVYITEFMASNTRTLKDENGDFSDWIELYNAGAATVNLQGWYLTDLATDLKQWQFPSVLLAPNGYVVVFATGSSQKDPARPLHTNFKLSASGEYLALVKPDGVTVASEYAPTFQQQVADVSYGIPVQQTTLTLVATNAAARIIVPADDLLEKTWTEADFDDSSWLNVTGGIGFDLDDLLTAEVVADSVTDFSGTQGLGN